MSNKKVSNSLFYVAYICLIFKAMFNNIITSSVVNALLELVQYISLIIVFFIQAEKYNIKTLFILSICGVVFAISGLITKNYSFEIYLLFIFASKNIDFTDLVRKDFYIKLFFSIIIFFLAFAGIAENEIVLNKNYTKNSLGFSSANYCSAFVFNICLDYFYLKYEKFDFRNIFLMILALVVFYLLTNTRSFLIVMLFLILFMFFIYIKRSFKINLTSIKKIMYKVFPVLFIVITILSIYLIVLYENKNMFIIDLDELLSNRIKFAHNFYNNYSVNLFGNEFIGYNEWSVDNLYALDNAFLNMLLQFGLLSFFIICKATNLLVKKAVEDKNTKLLLVIGLLFIYAFVETYYLRFVHNYIYIYLGKILFIDKEGKK